MKKILFSFVAIATALMLCISCGTPNEPTPENPDQPGNDTTVNNDTTPMTNEQLIVGVWSQDSAFVGNGNEASPLDDFAGDYTQFTADGKFMMADEAGMSNPYTSGAYSLMGPTLVMDYYDENGEIGTEMFYTIMSLDQTILHIRGIFDTEVVDYFFSRVK